MERLEVAKRLTAISAELSLLHETLASVLIEQTRARVSTFKGELLQGSSVSHAERMAEINTEKLTTDITRHKHKILSLEEERDNFRFLIKYGLESAI